MPLKPEPVDPATVARVREALFDPREKFYPPSLEVEVVEAEPATPKPPRASRWRLAAFPLLLVAGAAIGYFIARETPAPGSAPAGAVAPREAPGNAPAAQEAPVATTIPAPAAEVKKAPAATSGRIVNRAGGAPAAVAAPAEGRGRVTHTKAGAAREPVSTEPPNESPPPAAVAPNAPAASAAPAKASEGGTTPRPSAVVCTESLAALGICVRGP